MPPEYPTAPTPLTPPAAGPPARTVRPGILRQIPTWGWIVVGVVLLALFVVLSSLIAAAALVVLITAIVALAKNTPTWLGFRTRRSATVALVIAAVVLIVAGSVSSAVAGSSNTGSSAAEPRGFVGSVPSASATAERAGAADAKPRTPTAVPTPTPVIVESQQSVVEPIAFAEQSVDSADIPKGETRVSTEGANGEKTIVYAITTVDGVETSRTVVSEAVTLAPVDRVVLVGTYEAPVSFAGAAGGECDPNYADGCVPVASDVDCAGGSGNGPAYFSGTARVVGSDVYGLDRDGDGIACE